MLGLGFAAVTRIALLLSVVWLTRLRAPLFTWFDEEISVRDLALFAGGILLVVQSVKEIRDMLRQRTARRETGSRHVEAPAAVRLKRQLSEDKETGLAAMIDPQRQQSLRLLRLPQMQQGERRSAVMIFLEFTQPLRRIADPVARFRPWKLAHRARHR